MNGRWLSNKYLTVEAFDFRIFLYVRYVCTNKTQFQKK